MKNEEKVLKYFSGELNDKEKKEFESELKSSDLLRSEFKIVKDKLKKLDELKNVEADERYFASLVPRIKEKSEKQKKRKAVYKLSYGVVVLLIIITGIFYFTSNKTTETLTGTDFAKLLDEETSVDLLSDAIYYGEAELDYMDFNLTDFDISSEYFDDLTDSEIILILNSFDEKEFAELKRQLSQMKNL